MYEEKIMFMYYCACNNKVITRVDEKMLNLKVQIWKNNCVIVHDFENTCGKSKRKY